MKRLVLLVVLCVSVMTVGAAEPNKPLYEAIDVRQERTAAFRIEDVRDAQGNLIGYRLVETSGGQEVPGKVCLPRGVPAAALSIDNQTAAVWQIRVIPASAFGQPCSVRCARNVDELKANGLCDKPSDPKQCITSAANLGSCLGPECDFVRANCKLAGPASDRTCTVGPDPVTQESAIVRITKACEANRCELKQELSAFGAGAAGANAYEMQVYGRENVSAALPSAGFPENALGPPPYRVSIERADGTSPIPLEVAAYDPDPAAGCGTIVSVVPETTSDLRVAMVPLDNTGVASWVYLNPRNPACLNCDGKGIAPLAFVNRTGDRVFNVSVDLPADVAPLEATCTAGKPCKITRTVHPNTPVIFPPSLLSRVPKGTRLKFQIEFFDETEKVSNPFAYLRVSSEMDEPKSELQTAFVASLGGSLDPFVKPQPDTFTDNPVKDAAGNVITPADGKDDVTGYIPCYLPYTKAGEPPLCAAQNRIYDGKYSRHYTGLARIELSRALGDRADFNATVNYRTSDFGIDDGNVVKLSEYGINVYGENALTLRFGRTTWANPGNSIAILEKGDGYRVVWRNFSATHVLKRESAKSVADHDNDDHRSIILQMKALQLPFTHVRFLRGLKLLDFTAVRGEDKLSHVYRSAGAELFYAYTNILCRNKKADCSTPPVEGEPRKHWGTIAGSISAFQSTKHLSTRPPTGDNVVIPPRHGKGWAGLLSATWTPTTQKNKGTGATEAKHSVGLILGRGSSDDPNTEDTREDYVGESASFAPNSLLMSTFLSKIDVKDHVFIGPSLANKTLIGAHVSWNTWSPLVNLARMFGQNEVTSASTTARARQYRFGRPVYDSTNSREAAREYSLDFTVEVPKGVKVTIGGAYMQPGAGLDPVIGDDAWVLTSNISLRI